MRQIKLYTAISLDGFIARTDGSIDWLDAVPNPENIDYGYNEFYGTIDTTLMGYRTYEQILDFGGDFPYPDKKNYVISYIPQVGTDFVEFIHEPLAEFIPQLKNRAGKDVWLIGGGRLNAKMLYNGFIDKIILTMFPVMLGSGIHLFEGGDGEKWFELRETGRFPGGILQLIYDRKE